MNEQAITQRNILYHYTDVEGLNDLFSGMGLWYPKNDFMRYALLYCSVETLLFQIELTPLTEDGAVNQYHGYSWQSLLERSLIWTNFKKIKPNPHLGSFEFQGLLYSIPLYMICRNPMEIPDVLKVPFNPKSVS